MSERMASHIKVIGRRNSCQALSDAMVKHGKGAFTIALIEECASQKEMDDRETYWIEKLKTFAPGGYNLTRGGGGKYGYRHSAASREKMSAWQIGKILTPEHRAKVSASLKGNQRATGMKHTEATKQHLSRIFSGVKRKPFTTEHRANIAAAKTGKKASNAVRAAMSIARHGEKNNQSKLTDAQVLEIRSDPRHQEVIAAEHGVGQSTVSAIKLRRSWTHI